MRRIKILAGATLFCCLLGGTSFAGPGVDQCPRVTVSCPVDVVPIGAPLTFSADISGGDPAVTYTFRWVVSAGVITGGQNTSSITVDTSALGGQPLKATVEVGGFPVPCDRKASCSSQLAYICILPRKLDEYGDITIGDEKARLDNFAIELQHDPNAIGYIIVYGGRRSREGIAKTRASRARNFLVEYRGVAPERLAWIDGGYREDLTTELYILPRGVPAPTPAATVDPAEVKLIRDAKPKKRKHRTHRRRA
jgi:hypothetical protein